MYELTSQWPVEAGKLAGKRSALLRLLSEVGRPRFVKCIQAVVDEHQGRFFPTIAMIREYLAGDELGTKHFCELCIDGWVHAGQDGMGNRQVARCPNFGNPEYRVPADYDGITVGMRRDRQENPDNWYGWDDFHLYMELRRRHSRFSSDELWDAVLEIRRNILAARATQETEKRNRGMEKASHIMARLGAAQSPEEKAKS